MDKVMVEAKQPVKAPESPQEPLCALPPAPDMAEGPAAHPGASGAIPDASEKLRQQVPRWEWSTTGDCPQAKLCIGRLRAASVMAFEADSWELSACGDASRQDTPERIRAVIAALGLPELPDPPESA